MGHKRQFGVERGRFVVVRDESGAEVCFSTFAQFNEYYPGLDLSGKLYIDYRPEQNIYNDETDPTKGPEDIPEQAFEDVIDQTATLLENLRDPFYGLSLDDAKTLKNGMLKEEATTHFELTYDYMDIVGLLKTGADKTQFDLAYDEVVAAFIAARNQVNAAVDVAAVKAVTANWPTL